MGRLDLMGFSLRFFSRVNGNLIRDFLICIPILAFAPLLFRMGWRLEGFGACWAVLAAYGGR